jgi:hypothetical protein
MQMQMQMRAKSSGISIFHVYVRHYAIMTVHYTWNLRMVGQAQGLLTSTWATWASKAASRAQAAKKT